LPGLPNDAVIVMDNASFHRKKQLNEPKLNSIETVWSNIKKFTYKFSFLDDAIYSFFQFE